MVMITRRPKDQNRLTARAGLVGSKPRDVDTAIIGGAVAGGYSRLKRTGTRIRWGNGKGGNEWNGDKLIMLIS